MNKGVACLKPCIPLHGLGEDFQIFLTFISSGEIVPALHELRPLLLAE